MSSSLSCGAGTTLLEGALLAGRSIEGMYGVPDENRCGAKGDHLTPQQRMLIGVPLPRPSVADTLCTIRDPYARFSSAALYYSKLHFQEEGSEADPYDKFIAVCQGRNRCQVTCACAPGAPAVGLMHCVPQTDYTHPFGDNTSACSHIVDLAADDRLARALLASHGLAFPVERAGVLRGVRRPALLSRHRAWVEAAYARDFALLGYPVASRQAVVAAGVAAAAAAASAAAHDGATAAATMMKSAAEATASRLVGSAALREPGKSRTGDVRRPDS